MNDDNTISYYIILLIALIAVSIIMFMLKAYSNPIPINSIERGKQICELVEQSTVASYKKASTTSEVIVICKNNKEYRIKWGQKESK